MCFKQGITIPLYKIPYLKAAIGVLPSPLQWPSYLSTSSWSEFTTQETVRRLLQDNGHAFLTLFDVQKAFDSVELPVLLNCLYDAGVNGSSWRITCIKSWYEGSVTQIRVKDSLSDKVPIMRGVRQGSVLSPLLFIVVMDDLAGRLAAGGVGSTIEGMFVGGGIHADDVRTVSNDKEGVSRQAEIVDEFTASNGLQVNPSKTEVTAFSDNHTDFVDDKIRIGDVDVPIASHGCCLGYWWSRDLMSRKAVEENISKARKAFFATGSMGAFQGQLNPLSSRSLYRLSNPWRCE